MTERIGVFGGTFDPVHIGHLLFAEAARAQAGLLKVVFMPVHIQPFKQDMKISSGDDRVRMLKLAVKNNPYFGVSTIEIDNGGISYTIDSLREFQSQNKDARVCFLLGTDMFLNIEKWKQSDELLREFDLAIGTRPGYKDDEASALAEKLKKTYGTRIDFVDNPPIDLSSTEIRQRVNDGHTIRYRVHEDVRRFLMVMEKEGAERFAHTKRVIDLALEMADRFGVDSERAGLAALLHDYRKEPDGGVENDLSHGELAAEAIRSEFGIADEDILNAVRYHTTGRAGMSRLEKIIFLADTVEPGRTYDSIAGLREKCLNDLDNGALTVLTELKIYLEKKGLEVSKDTEAAIAELRGETKEKIIEH